MWIPVKDNDVGMLAGVSDPLMFSPNDVQAPGIVDLPPNKEQHAKHDLRCRQNCCIL